MRFPFKLLVAWIVLFILLETLTDNKSTPKPTGYLVQVWVCEQRYNPQSAIINGLTTCISHESAVWDTCLYYLPFWEPIHQGDTIETLTLDFVPLYRIQ